MTRSYLSELDLTVEETKRVLEDAKWLKEGRKRTDDLKGKHVALYFEKPSVRTRTSFTIGVHELGGQVVELGSHNTKVGKGEEIADFASVIGRYVDILVARVFAQSSLVEMVEYSRKPVINALSDDRHPTQAIADLQTIIERKGKLDGLKLGYVGEGNNVATSTGLLAAAFGMHVVIASPKGYGLPDKVLEEAEKLAGKVEQVVDPEEAFADADVLYTDTWVSMGQEEESKKRRKIFKGYKINGKALKKAKSDAIVMHCLPAIRDDEIDAETMYGPQSAIWDQAENRLHAQKALLRFFAKA